MARLLKLSLQNYRNIKSLELDFGGRNVKIVGANRIGKTNAIEAICYLLTDKLLGGSADIPSIKPHEDTRLTVVVEGTFDVNGDVVVLRKEFGEKWVKPRGSVREELQGHYTAYFVNGAKQARAQDFCDQLIKKFGFEPSLHKLDAYQLATDPFYFAETICGSKDWKLAREAIIEIVGDVSPGEIFSYNPKILVAKPDLEAHQFDDAEAKKALRGEIEGYKSAIAANQRLIEEFSRTEDVSDAEFDAARDEDESIVNQIGQLRAGVANPYADEVTALQTELSGLQDEYSKIVNAPIDHTKSELARKKVNEIKDELDRLQRQARNAKADWESYNATLTYKKKLQQDLKNQLEALKAQLQSIMVEDVCPTCGQPLPPEKIQEAVNIKKAEISAKAQSVREEALANKNAIEEIEGILTTLASQTIGDEIAKLEARLAEAEEALQEAIKAEEAGVKKPDESLKKRIIEIGERLNQIKLAQAQGSSNVDFEITRLANRRRELALVRDRRVAYAAAQRRIAELNEEIKSDGNKQADAEQRLWAIGEFVKTKLILLDEHMASTFGEVRFQLIKENIKAGSYDEVCVPYIVSPSTGKGTKTLFPDGSKSEQIYTGIQIIKAIRKSNGWQPLPIVFDQGGELDGITCAEIAREAEAQIIAVKVEGFKNVPTVEPIN